MNELKEKIEAKVTDIIMDIIAKDPKDITYNEYRILDAKLISIKFDEEQKDRNKKMAELMASSVCGFGSPMPLPEPTEEE